MPKQALLTDLGNVLVTFWERKDLVRAIVEGFDGDPKTVANLFPAGQGEDIYETLDRGDLDFRDFHREICRVSGVSGITLPYDRFLMVWARHLEIIKPVAELYRSIQKNIPIIAVSNGDIGSFHAADLLQVYGGVKFKEVFVSSAYHITKPQLFSVVVEYLESNGFDLELCPYVDDLPRYAQSANVYGIPGILFNGREQSCEVLQQELGKFGIE